MSTSGYIFLSYRSTEREYALKLAAALKSAGVHIWMDVLDSGIKVGDDWVQVLQDSLDSCAGMIAVLSPDYVTSRYCRRELKRADTLGCPIYPVLLRPLRSEQWPLEIQERQYIDFVAWRDEHIFAGQLAALVDVLRDWFPQQVGDVPDLETQYLLAMIADVESKRGVLEYLELEFVQETEFRPTIPDDEWGFELLLDNPAPASSGALSFGDMEAIIKRLPRFTLVGDSGSGKSTTLRRFARDLAHKRLTHPRTARLPLLLSLSEWPDGSPPAKFAASHWPFPSDLEGALRSGDVVLCLDGLNEMGADRKDKAHRLSTWLDDLGEGAQAIVTCRRTDHDAGLRLPSLPLVLVQPLTTDKIRAFARAYLGDRAAAFLTRIQLEAERTDRDNRDSSLASLATNPYMLSALIYLHSNAPEGELPKNMGLLFQRLTRALWERERLRRTSGGGNLSKRKPCSRGSGSP